jgi:hypothetical protein
MGDPLLLPGKGCLINKNLKIAQIEVELVTFGEEKEEKEEDTIELGEV